MICIQTAYQYCHVNIDPLFVWLHSSTVTWFLNDLKYSNDVRFFLSCIKIYEKSEHLGYINIFLLLASLETHQLSKIKWDHHIM